MGGEADDAFPSCRASEPLIEESFARPKPRKRQMRFQFAVLLD